ncbi:hypothetical protein NHX12_027978 [Muraenolepis orangiensis]|uniref:Protein Spindly n=1 Tax=Muraenolepis orangiensis TaxID=630683 RepID=A0A9Q0IPR4_9TELE|nr:hypothetical protein NHX12_027978 [Muraenolepis orangiensis]
MCGALEAAMEDIQTFRRRLRESEEQVQQAAHAGLNLLNQQVELQTRLEEQRVEMTNAVEILEQEKYSLQREVELRMIRLQADLEESQLIEKQLKHKLEVQTETLNHKMEELSALNEQKQDTFSSEIMEMQMNGMELEGKKAQLEVSLQEAQYKEQQLELSNGSLRRQLKQMTEEKEEREKEAVSWFNALGKCRDVNQELQVQLELVLQQAQDPNSQGNSLFAELEDKRAAMEQSLLSMKVQHQSLHKQHGFSKQQLHRMKVQIATLMQLQGTRADPAQLERLQSMLCEKNEEIHNLVTKLHRLEKVEMLFRSQSSVPQSEGREDQDETYYTDLLQMKLSNSVKDTERLGDQLSLQRMKSLSESQRALELERKLYSLEHFLKQAQSDKIKLQLRVDELRHQYEPHDVHTHHTQRRKREKLPDDPMFCDVKMEQNNDLENKEPTEPQTDPHLRADQPTAPQTGPHLRADQPTAPQTGPHLRADQPTAPQTGPHLRADQPTEPQTDSHLRADQPTEPKTGPHLRADQPTEPKTGPHLRADQPTEPKTGPHLRADQPTEPKTGPHLRADQPTEPKTGPHLRADQPTEPKTGPHLRADQPTEPKTGPHLSANLQHVAVLRRMDLQLTQDHRSGSPPAKCLRISERPPVEIPSPPSSFVMDCEEKQKNHREGIEIAVFLVKSDSALIVVDKSEEVDDEATVVDVREEEDLEVFQPTEHWQTLKPGQAVPAGSHVRLNLQTGQREVRLGEEQIKHRTRPHRPEQDSQSYFSSDELKWKLKKLKDSAPPSKDADQQDQNKFRSLEELKRDMAALNLHVETDSQIIKRLLDELNSSTTEQRLEVLLELEYLVHQVDNGQMLCSMGGLQLILGGLNSSDYRLQDRSAFVLGSALASNPAVQVEVVERGGLQKLLTLLATPRPLSVKKKALFALASLLRHFPYAQSHFLSHGGLQVLSEVFREDLSGSVRVRVVTLLYDMITEKELNSKVSLDQTQDASQNARLDQYSKLSLQTGLQEGRWCSLIQQLLHSGLQTMLALVPVCLDQYRSDGSLPGTLGSMKAQYQELVQQEQALGEPHGYFREVLDLVLTLELQIN